MPSDANVVNRACDASSEAGGYPGTGWVIYTGGPPEGHLAALKHVLPPGAERVTVHADGSIEYERTPEDRQAPSPIDGYRHSRKNPWLLRPIWQSCQWRLYGLEADHPRIDVVAMCNNPFAETLGRRVKCADCERCDKRAAIPTPLPPPQAKQIIEGCAANEHQATSGSLELVVRPQNGRLVFRAIINKQLRPKSASL